VTIATRNSRTNAESIVRRFTATNPDVPVTMLLIDGDDIERGSAEGYDVILPDDLDLDPVVFGRLATMYDAPALADALRPFLIETRRDRGDEAVTFLECDVGSVGDRVRGDALPYRYDRAPSGARISIGMRRAYRGAIDAAETDGGFVPPSAFDAAGDAGFLRWLGEPYKPASRVSRLLHETWLRREDLRGAFLEPWRADADRLAEWAVTDPTYVTQAHAYSRASNHLPGATKGVNLVGYLAGQFGLGEAGRHVARMVRAAGVPLASNALYPTGQTNDVPVLGEFSGAPFDLSMLAMNADALLDFSTSVEFLAHRDRHCIGVWYWEVGELPTSMGSAERFVDEIWCSTEHIRSLLAGSIDRPVLKHPLIVEVPTRRTALRREDLGLPADGFLFGFAFDFLSVTRRKNPHGLIDAYRRAFGPDDGAVLVLKTINGRDFPAGLASVRDAIGDRADIVLLDVTYSPLEMRAFFQLLDGYVSLHRSEGLGLTIAAAMAAGTPCIATGWSGNLEFMTAGNSVLVPYDLVPVGPDADPYPTAAMWAEPDLAAAAEAMRALFDDREGAAALGARGRADMIANHNAATAAEWFVARFEERSMERNSHDPAGRRFERRIRTLGSRAVRDRGRTRAAR
jgi:glycosyltransferase involved in cell wall biosynthesis